MKTTVEISLYPLSGNYVPEINDFIARLKAHSGLDIVVNAMSTQIVGELAHIFDVLAKETEATFSKGHNVFVIKVTDLERDIHRPRS